MPVRLVAWAGQPLHWNPPVANRELAQWLLAATEDALPSVLQSTGLKTISHEAVINVLDRNALRHALRYKHSPVFTCFDYASKVIVKSPASAGSSGVHLLDLRTEELKVLVQVRDLCARLGMQNLLRNLRGVVEEFVFGDAIELSGVKLDGNLHFFHPLRQFWSEDWKRITGYGRCFEYWWLYEQTAEVLNTVKLNNSSFCVEWRVTGDQEAKVIEINPRIGDDDQGYFEALWDKPVAEQIEEWANSIQSKQVKQEATVSA